MIHRTAALVVFGIAFAGFAHEVKFKADRTGTLKEIYPDRLVVSIPKSAPLTIFVNDTTIVHRNGKDVHLEELKVGDAVLVHVMPNEDGSLYGVEVEARRLPHKATDARKRKQGNPPK